MLNQARVDGLLKYMGQLGLKQMLLQNPMLIRYFLDINIRGTDRASILYISHENGIKLIENRLHNHPADLGLEQLYHGDQDDVCAEIARCTMHDQPLGLDGAYPAKWLLPLIERGAASSFVLGDRAIKLQRAHKEPDELQYLREASQMNDRVMAKVRGLFHTGITEREISQKISAMFKDEGADVPGWALVAFGANSANVHHWCGETPLKEGDTIIIDMGAPRKGYHSDMTRTFFWKSVSSKQREVYELVKHANKAAEQAIRPGIRCCDLDKIARNIISDAGYGPYFTHRLGHYIGIELHDPGDIAAYNPDPIEPTMTFSCEPGVYLPNEFGVRIEDLVIVTDDGCEILNQDNKELEVLGT